MEHFDLIIIGGGSAAFSAAIRANEMKLNTLLINGGLPLGGTCVNVGCLPSKFLIRAAEQIHKASYSPFEGIIAKGATIDFTKIMQQKKKLVAEMQQKKYLDLLNDLEFMTIIEGFASFIDKNSILINYKEYKAIKIIIATGSSTLIPGIKGLENVQYFTNDTLFDLDELPESLIIIGGGYIGLEIAQAYSRFGSKVSIIEMADHILSTETKDISDEITHYLNKEGIKIYTGNSVKQVKQVNNLVHVEMDDQNLVATHLVLATGRKANTENLNLENADIALNNKGFIEVNEKLETNVPNIYAIGDVNIFPPFVYAAAYEGGIAVANAFEGSEKTVDYSSMPWVIFTDPQVVGVGIDEQAAQEENIPFEITSMPLSEVPRSVAALDTRGFIKLIRNPETDLLLGARIIAPEGSELAMEISLAIKYKVPVKDIIATLHPYLTLSEGIKLAAMSFTTDLKKMSCCAS
ncbi:MAG: mercury(II) reductase [Bacteroidota bacterium]|nr:mercury(II) reductase [Bacteroidota bacterium]